VPKRQNSKPSAWSGLKSGGLGLWGL